MLSFLESFIVKWLYFSLSIIIVFALFLIYSNKNKILKEIKNNKKVFLLLFIILITGSVLRFGFISTFFVADDGKLYDLEAKEIYDKGIFRYGGFDYDSPAFPILISSLMKLFGEKVGPGHTNALFGSLSIILIFILVQLLFNNYKISLLSAFLLTFNNFHLEFSVRGWPHVSSTFFIMLAIVFLIFSIRNNLLIYFLMTGITIAYTAQMYYVEIVLVLPFIIYFLIKKRFDKRTILNLSIFLIIILLSISPFILLENLSYSPESKPNGLLGKTMCIWSPGRCERFNSGEVKQTFNHIENGLLSYLAFNYLGMGSKSSYYSTYISDGWYYSVSKYRVNNKINFVYIMSTILILFGMFNLRRYRKEWFFIFLINLIFIGSFSIHYDRPRFNLIYIIIFTIILISFGLIRFINLLRKKGIGRTISHMILLLITLILVSPFSNEDMINNLKLTKGDNLKSQWDEIYNVILLSDKEDCNSLETEKMKYECENWFDIYFTINNKLNCDLIKDGYFKEQCYKRNSTYLELKDIIKESSKYKIYPYCWNKNFFKIYCKSPFITEEHVKKVENNIQKENCDFFDNSFRSGCLKSIQISKDFEKEQGFLGNCGMMPKLCFLINVFNLDIEIS